MFNNLEEALEILYTRQHGTKPRLAHFIKMLADLGNPQKQLKVIHVTGTNGKGSTTNFLRNVYQLAGYKVASFTSPHLVCHNDRFRINNVYISDAELLKYINWSYQYWDLYQLSMFEIDVLISIYYFIDQKVDLAIYEVGMGGRFDATNVFDNIACVITNISYDHMQFLGDTLEAIAYEKAGIIKGCPYVFTNVSNQNLLTIFARENNGNIIQTPVYKAHKQKLTICNLEFSLKSLAAYQIENAALAVSVIKYLNNVGLFRVSDDILVAGINQTDWPGRFEFLDSELPIIIDGAHNLAGIKNLTLSLDNLKQDFVIVFSALKDKDINNMLKWLLSKKYDIIITSFENRRKASKSDLMIDDKLIFFDDYLVSIKYAYQKAISENKGLVITGSLYFISEIRKRWIDNELI